MTVEEFVKYGSNQRLSKQELIKLMSDYNSTKRRSSDNAEKLLEDLIVKNLTGLSNKARTLLKKYADNALSGYSRKTRPAAVSILERGEKRIFAYSSKSGLGLGELPKGLHPLVNKWLKNAPEKLKRRRTHGKCAEPTVISKWLWEVDPKGKWDINQARKEFEDIVSQARQISKATPTEHNTIKKACDSCNPLLKHFNITEIKI